MNLFKRKTRGTVTAGKEHATVRLTGWHDAQIPPKPAIPPEIPYDSLEPRGRVFKRDGWWTAEVRAKSGELLWSDRIRAKSYGLNIMMSRCRRETIENIKYDRAMESAHYQCEWSRRFLATTRVY